MQAKHLAKLVGEPTIIRTVLAGYDGPYALGVASSDAGEPVIRLRVTNDDFEFPNAISVEGETVRVIVDTKWRAPRLMREEAIEI